MARSFTSSGRVRDVDRNLKVLQPCMLRYEDAACHSRKETQELAIRALGKGGFFCKGGHFHNNSAVSACQGSGGLD